jgi:tetratricopeptide (TPR) repeat protein
MTVQHKPAAPRRAFRQLSMLVGVALSLCGLLLACVESRDTVTPARHQGQACGVTEGAFRSRWWNYYERGLSFAACGDWREAEQDLRQALSLRAQDQRRARTYGMHFVDYFGHRELGIVLYRQGRLDMAIDELQTSLASVKSAKAEVYLDRARKLLIEKNQLDRIPPSIDIESPRDNALVQGFSIKVQGVVRDDTYVKQIIVNGVPVRIDLGAPRIRFEMEVPLKRLGNRIEIVAKDITGRTSSAFVQVEADREGPVLGIEDAEPGKRLKGYVEDPSGLAEVKINGQPVPLVNGGLLPLDQALPPTLQRSRLLIEAMDRAGNLTLAEMDFSDRLNGLPRQRPLLAASNKVAGVFAGPAAQLTLNYRSDSQTLYLDQIYLQGSVSLPGGVASLKADGVELLRRPGKTVFFTHRLGLRVGANPLRLSATDTNGAVMARDILLTRSLKQLDRREARYRLAVLGQPGSSPAALAGLSAALRQAPRFQPAADSPLALGVAADAEPISPQAAADAGKNIADGVLLTRVQEKGDALEYIGQLIDTRSGEEIVLVDAYQDSQSDAVSAAAALLARLEEQLPLSHGELTSIAPTQLGLRWQGDSGGPPNMPVWLYREPSSRQDPRTGAPLGADHLVLGLAHWQRDSGYALPQRPALFERLRRHDRVLSR